MFDNRQFSFKNLTNVPPNHSDLTNESTSRSVIPPFEGLREDNRNKYEVEIEVKDTKPHKQNVASPNVSENLRDLPSNTITTNAGAGTIAGDLNKNVNNVNEINKEFVSKVESSEVKDSSELKKKKSLDYNAKRDKIFSKVEKLDNDDNDNVSSYSDNTGNRLQGKIKTKKRNGGSI